MPRTPGSLTLVTICQVAFLKQSRTRMRVLGENSVLEIPIMTGCPRPIFRESILFVPDDTHHLTWGVNSWQEEKPPIIQLSKSDSPTREWSIRLNNWNSEITVGWGGGSRDTLTGIEPKSGLDPFKQKLLRPNRSEEGAEQPWGRWQIWKADLSSWAKKSRIRRSVIQWEKVIDSGTDFAIAGPPMAWLYSFPDSTNISEIPWYLFTKFSFYQK